ncbi:citrate lyase acyl carrier protein [Synergistales bacterium]|nr:citrate lyase acyl carrier protein [Synergistales bacterium]
MKKALAGTLESSDCCVTLTEKNLGSGLSLTVSGTERFMSAITETVGDVAGSFGISDVDIFVQDRGALDVVLRSRLEAAILRYETDEA